MSLELSFPFKIDSYDFRMFYVIPMVTTKKVFIKYTAREARREQQVVTLKNQLDTKECSKVGNEEENCKTCREQKAK